MPSIIDHADLDREDLAGLNIQSPKLRAGYEQIGVGAFRRGRTPNEDGSFADIHDRISETRTRYEELDLHRDMKHQAG